MTEIRLKAAITDGMTARNRRAVQRHLFPDQIWWTLGLGGLTAICLLGRPVMERVYGFGFEWLALLLPLVAILWVVRSARTRRRWRSAQFDAPLRQGYTEFRLDPEGVHTRHPGAECSFFWHHVTDVLATDWGVLILLSPAEYLPIPQSALPVGMTSESLRERILEWMAASKADWEKRQAAAAL